MRRLTSVAEAGGTRLLVHVDDILAVDAQAVAHAIVAGEIRRGFGRSDDIIGRQGVFRVRQRDVDDLGAGILQPGDALLPKGLDLFRHAIDAVFVRNADPHTLERLAERSFIIRHRQINRGRILGVDARHRFQQDGCIADVAGDRTGLIERRGESDNAPARAAAIGRLDADRAGEGRGLANGAAGIGSSRASAEMRGDGSGRTARGTAGNELLVGARGAPGVDHRAVVGSLVGGAHGELIHVEFAQHDGAVVPEVLR